MFGIKDICNDLQYSQRFSYSNIEYYNDYDKPSNFKNDISKIFHNCRRKIIPHIYFYKNDDNANNRILKNKNITMDEAKTMQVLLGTFLQAFFENNYCDYNDGALQGNKNRYMIHYYPKQENMKENMMSYQLRNKKKTNKISLDFVRLLIDILQEDITNIINKEKDGNIQQKQFDFYRFWLALAELSYCELHPASHQKQKIVQQAEGINQFKILIQNILTEISNLESQSHLLLYIPNISYMSYLFNPLLAGVHNFLRMQESYSKSDSVKDTDFVKEIPKIAFINLDGSETPLNLQIVSSSSPSCLFYVSIYNENDPLGKCVEETQATLAYSQLLIKLIGGANRKNEQMKEQRNSSLIYFPKVLAFPLNSPYIRKQLSGRANGCLDGSSEDINFLFQNVIFDEIRTFNTNIIIVSYSGRLHLSETHFNNIIRNLSIICDHRIILFPNLCNLLQRENPLLKFSQIPNFNPVSEEADILTMANHLETFQQEQLEELNLNQFFNNLGMFLKIASGAYSMEKRKQNGSHQMYEAGNKYEYMSALSKIPELKYMNKFCSTAIKGSIMRNILHSKRRQFLNRNIQDVEFYQNILDQAANIIFLHPETLPLYLAYRYQRIRSQFPHCQTQIRDYIEENKNKILIKCIKIEKAHKKYTVDPTQNKLKVYQFFMRQKGDIKKLYFDNFTQIIFDPTHTIVFCLNYLNINGKTSQFVNLYGLVPKNSSDIEMRIIPNSKMKLGDNNYFSFGHCFSRTNKYLYLYWPYEWNRILQAQCLLLGIKYEPKPVHRLVIIQFSVNGNDPIWMEMTPDQHTLQSVVAKNGSAGWAKSDTQIYIFGGICSSQHDFMMKNSSGVSVLNIASDSFSIKNIQKQTTTCQMRPKINYQITQKEPNILCINRGYGRQFTNLYNIYSYLQYMFDVQTMEMSVQKVQRQINCIQKPMKTQKTKVIGNTSCPLPISSFQKQQSTKNSQIQNLYKHKFILQSANGNNNEAISFIDGNYTHKNYEDPICSTKYSFGFRKVITAILTHTHTSPELYLQNQKYQLIRVELLLQILKNQSNVQIIHKKQAIFPYEDSIVSACMSTNSMFVYLLVKSPLFTDGKFVIYEGNLGSQYQQVLKTKQLILNPYYTFNNGQQNCNLCYKTLFCSEKGVLLVGGWAKNNRRVDYLIERKVKRTNIQSYHLHLSQQQNRRDILQFPNCFIFNANTKQQNNYYIYCITYNQNIKQWELKIQSMSLNNKLKRTVSISTLTFCAIVEQPNQDEELEERVYEIIPAFQKPIITNITRAKIHLGLRVVKDKAQALLILIRKMKNQLKNKQLSVLHELENVCLFMADAPQTAITSKQEQILFKMPIALRGVKKNESELSESDALIRLGIECLNSFEYYRMIEICKHLIEIQEDKQIYQFCVEDRHKSLIKYMGLGEIGSSNLILFRVRFQSQILLPFANCEYVSDEFLGKSLNEKKSFVGMGKQKFLNKIMKYSEDNWALVGDLEPQENMPQSFTISVNVANNK